MSFDLWSLQLDLAISKYAVLLHWWPSVFSCGALSWRCYVDNYAVAKASNFWKKEGDGPLPIRILKKILLRYLNPSTRTQTWCGFAFSSLLSLRGMTNVSRILGEVLLFVRLFRKSSGSIPVALFRNLHAFSTGNLHNFLRVPLDHRFTRTLADLWAVCYRTKRAFSYANVPILPSRNQIRLSFNIFHVLRR